METGSRHCKDGQSLYQLQFTLCVTKLEQCGPECKCNQDVCVHHFHVG